MDIREQLVECKRHFGNENFPVCDGA